MKIAKTILAAAAGAAVILCASATAQVPLSNWNAAIIKSVRVDGNGLLLDPTNLFSANAALLNAAVTNGGSGLVPNEVFVETNGNDTTAALFVAQNGGGSHSVPFLTIQAAVTALAYPTNSGGIIHVGYGRFTAPGAFVLTNLTVTQGGSPSPAVAGNYVLGGDPSFPNDYYRLNGSSNYYITAVAGSYWKLQNKSRTAFYEVSQSLFGTWAVTNGASGAVTVAASTSDPLNAAYRGWHLVGRQMPGITSFNHAEIFRIARGLKSAMGLQIGRRLERQVPS